MRKAIATLAVVTVAVLLSSALQANFTMFDLAKDSMFIARGEFTSLNRTAAGDRLTLRCDELIKGDLAAGSEVTLEAFEPAPADEALGREVIVCFNLINGKHYFLYHPFAQRSFTFGDGPDDQVPNALDQDEQSIRNFMAINAPHQEVILTELRKRLEMQDSGYEGEYDKALINEWKAELLKQVTWAGTRAAKDAAKALVEHKLFKGTCTVDELRAVGQQVTHSQVGSLERAYELELIRQEPSAHPTLEEQLNMLREETSQSCVGKLSSLMNQVENREAVLAGVGMMAQDANMPAQSRVNALQMLQALKDTAGLPYVHAAIQGELERGPDANKDVLRRAFSALRSTPSETNVDIIEASLDSDYVKESWELQQRAWVAYAMIDSEETNATITAKCNESFSNKGLHKFFQKLLPTNKIIRKLIIIHPED
ncbi:MAG: hypothetical protein KDB82_15620 [Planctomycetes bacterium]|nr:hypothetical protein [Planctomycetota bacterium]